MNAAGFSRFDPSEYLDTDEGMEEFMIAALETGDASFIARSLGVIAKAHTMTHVANAIGVSRGALYKALAEEGSQE